MKLGGITFSDLLGGYEIVNESASKLPQDVASGFHGAVSELLGATYTPIWYVGKQLVNGVNHFLICKEIRISAKHPVPMVVGLVFNIPAGEGACKGEGAKVVRIIEEADLPAELRTIFDRAEKQLIGVGYKPIAYVGSQVVRGVNHYFICQAKGIYPDAEPYAVMMVVNFFKDEVTIVSIEQL